MFSLGPLILPAPNASGLSRTASHNSCRPCENAHSPNRSKITFSKRKVTLCEIAGLPGRNKVEPLVGKGADVASQLEQVEEQTAHRAHHLKHARASLHRRRPDYPMSAPAPRQTRGESLPTQSCAVSCRANTKSLKE